LKEKTKPIEETYSLPNDSTGFKLERYKYILQQLNSLNENTHKYLSLYQTLATAVIAGGIAVLVGWKELKIDAETAKVGIRGLLGLLLILTLFVIGSVLSNIYSWMDYRNEEVELLDKEVYKGFRPRPNIKNLWRWHETYLLLFILGVLITIFYFAECKVMPLIN
jgi:hypothetical protein